MIDLPYEGKPLTLSQAKKALGWFICELGLHAWKIDVQIGESPPSWVSAGTGKSPLGMCEADTNYRHARVWVRPSRCEQDKQSQISTLFHEGLHIVAAEAGIEPEKHFSYEYQWNRLSNLLAALYMKVK